GNGIYSLSRDIPALDPQSFYPGMEIPLTIVAEDMGGLQSVPWPRFRIQDLYAQATYDTQDPYYRYEMELSKGVEDYEFYSYPSFYPSFPDVPRIKAMGYLDTVLKSTGGLLKVFVQFDENEVNQIEKVEINNTGIFLNNLGMKGDLIPGDAYFTFEQNFTGNLPVGDFFFKYYGITQDGKYSQPAPNLVLN
ncbi:hypothetical protein KKB18_07500, partial [bacterium]|nr:hypothetical protein [bacterium]